MIEIQKQSLSETFSVYFDKRMLKILLLGAISGFPWVLIGSSLSLWLKEDGLSRSTVGWAGLIFAVYAFNYLWAPLIDRIQIPYLTKKIGHRRGWIVLMQLLILGSLGLWSFINPTENFKLGLFAATGGIFLVYLISFIMSFFGSGLSIMNPTNSSLMSIGFSLFVVVIASLNLVLDFDFIEEASEVGAPKYMEWYGVFGLLVTLIWLYLEILRLLAKLNSRRN